MARHGLRRAPARRAGAGHGACHLCTHGLLARARGRAGARLRRGRLDEQASPARRPVARLRVALRARARLSQGPAFAAGATRRVASAKAAGSQGYRVFVDSAPVLEKALARDAGLGWIGKHTNLLDRHAGSWFFLGEIFTDLPLPVDAPVTSHCGSCTACIDICPTRAIVAPVRARCAPLHLVSHDRAPRRDSGGIPHGDRQSHLRLRRLPARLSVEPLRAAHRRAGFPAAPRARRRPASSSCSRGPRSKFLERTAGSAIRRSVTSAGCATSRSRSAMRRRLPQVLASLARASRRSSSPLVREHVAWALGRHGRRRQDRDVGLLERRPTADRAHGTARCRSGARGRDAPPSAPRRPDCGRAGRSSVPWRRISK